MAFNFNDPEVALMEYIRKRHGAAIVDACHGSSVRPEFVAALIGNESGGDERATRFEPAVFGKLLEVCAGKRAEYKPAGIKAPLGAVDLVNFIANKPAPGGGAFLSYLVNAVKLATSHGLTQIMGWHCIEFGRDFGILAMPAGQLRFTIELLTWFAQSYNLNLGTEDTALLRCWNTGRPDGATFDSQYVPKGIRREDIYRGLLAAPAPV